MTNWVSQRMFIAGPAYEMQRFTENCIRAQRDDTETSLDFEGIVPMPDVIARTMDDRSREAELQARLATGYDSWYEWSLAHWGTKWNTSNFAELFRDSERLDCFFSTAWSYPAPLLNALALQYPSLTIQVFAIEEGNDWAYVGDIRGGVHTGSDVPITRRLKHVVYEADGGFWFPMRRPIDPPFISLDLEAKIHGIRRREDADERVNEAWSAAHAHLGKRELAQLGFAEDVEGFLEWLDIYHDSVGAPSWDAAQDVLGRYVESTLNLRFFVDQNRFSTDVDRDVMRSIGSALRTQALSGRCSSTPGALGAASIGAHSEEALRAWAAYAMFRPGPTIDSTDATSLRASMMAMHGRWLREALQHVDSTYQGATDEETGAKAA